MSLNLAECEFRGPALPEPYAKGGELEEDLNRHKLLPKASGSGSGALGQFWTSYQRKLRALAASGGDRRVLNHVIEPIVEVLGYKTIEKVPAVRTREDLEEGGYLLTAENGKILRVWGASFNQDLLAPSERGKAYRFSPIRVGQRVLLAAGETAGVITNGVQLVLLLSDPARAGSTITIPIEQIWKRSREAPDSFRFLLAIASPAGIDTLPEIIEKARHRQTKVTRDLRDQARKAIEGFLQEIIEHPENKAWLGGQLDLAKLAEKLWHEALIIVYRLLFVLKLESSDDPARAFTFASSALWRNTFSPTTALARIARRIIDYNLDSGQILEKGLRALFRAFEEGLECSELVIKPLGGALFGTQSTPILAARVWGERAVAQLFDQLLWTNNQRRAESRERVHYGSLDVEDLGRVYEALLELEPGITSERMCRLRRAKLEVVVPVAQGESYRPICEEAQTNAAESDDREDDTDETDDEESTGRASGTQVHWIEEIPPGRFYLRVGLGRKASGSYYTRHSFVRFLVQETLEPLVHERSPQDAPSPLSILKLKVLDPAMGSGHFLVEACRYLGDKLYEACRLCDDKALQLERRAEKVGRTERQSLENLAAELRQRVIDLPDPDDELFRYMPSRAPEQEVTGFSQKKAEALCRRLVATHCLYGVDKNPLAVELAKLSLWLESHAEGMPTTFLDHRLLVGDSLTGPFF